MKILHIISSLEIGGAQRLLSEILPILAEHHNVSLMVNNDVSNDFSRKIKDAGVDIIPCSCANLYNPFNIIQIAKLGRGFDIVHVHLFPSVYWAAFAVFIMPLNLIYTEHSTSNRRRGNRLFLPIERFVYSKYKRIISISQQTQDSLTTWLKTKPNDQRFVVVNNGVNLTTFQNIKNNKIYPYTLIMISRFAASKDHMTVIRAMKRLPSDIHTIFVGNGDNLDVCKKCVVDEGLIDRIHFVGEQSDIVSWIGKADIGVQSSNWEGFGLTAVELMAAGLPVVASNVEGLKQVVDGAGVLFNVGDDRTLAEIILKLKNDKAYYKQIADNCQIRATQYDIRKMTNSYVNIYNDLIKEKNE